MSAALLVVAVVSWAWGVVMGVTAMVVWERRGGRHTDVMPSLARRARRWSLRTVGIAAVFAAVLSNVAVGFLQIENSRRDDDRDRCIQRDRMEEAAFYRTLRRELRAPRFDDRRLARAVDDRITSLEGLIRVARDESTNCRVEGP